jgi:hypothetical protein
MEQPATGPVIYGAKLNSGVITHGIITIGTCITIIRGGIVQIHTITITPDVVPVIITMMPDADAVNITIMRVTTMEAALISAEAEAVHIAEAVLITVEE